MPNAWLRRMMLAVGMLLIMLLAVPPLRSLMKIELPPASGALVTAATLGAAVLWLELVRFAAGALPWRPLSPPASTG
jgi:Ca2+-transporting ATPase